MCEIGLKHEKLEGAKQGLGFQSLCIDISAFSDKNETKYGEITCKHLVMFAPGGWLFSLVKFPDIYFLS